MKRRLAPALAGLALAVLLLHGWLIEHLAGVAVRPELRAAVRSASAVQALASVTAPPAEADPVPAELEPPAAGALALAVEAPAPAQAATRKAPPPPPRAPRPPAERQAEPPPAATSTALMTAEPASAAAAEPSPEAAQVEPALLLAAAAAPAAAAASDDGTPPPVYRTRIPPPARLSYRLSRSGLVGIGDLDWQPQGRSYSLRLEGKLPPLGTLIVQTSRGGFDAAGLAPERHTDKRLRRGEQAANFQRDKNRISFSGPDTELPLLPGVQDRLSVMLQLAAIANAWSRPPAAGTELRIQVVGARGDANLWTLRYDGPQAVQTAAGSVNALHFLREPAGPYDTRAEFWLDGARSYLPVRVRLTDGRGETLELLRDPPVP